MQFDFLTYFDFGDFLIYWTYFIEAASFLLVLDNALRCFVNHEVQWSYYSSFEQSKRRIINVIHVIVQSSIKTKDKISRDNLSEWIQYVENIIV